MKLSKIIGWLAILLAVCSLVPSLVPGVMSLIGLVIGLFSIVISLLSVGKGGRGYFRVTAWIVLLGMVLVNDAVRLFGSLPEIPIEFKLAVYGFSGLVIFGCFIGAKTLHRSGRERKR